MYVLSAETVNCFNTVLHRFRLHRDVMYKFSLRNSRNRKTKCILQSNVQWSSCVIEPCPANSLGLLSLYVYAVRRRICIQTSVGLHHVT